MTPKGYTPLALLAADAEDLQVVSAVLQDAVAKVGDMAYLPARRRFAFVANRFVWEEGASKTKGPFTRVRAGIHFDDVTAVRKLNLDTSDPGAVVDVLCVAYEGGEDGGTVTITLAGGGAVALDVEAINATAEDISEPWRTQSKPDHETA
ncbi:DUF2948 family protein [Parvularcula dongshanensis]|uniref:DUF2948 family protein n=1 Tax=Parvularcula dongshanensis TaxID=1173995 RepID=A0A840I196_9PROT|nr:DUF2948 family protein [Parvularcula dongshanensis]MBB4657860.1 hypothetical protein [Parvularcula dongshanensis]